MAYEADPNVVPHGQGPRYLVMTQPGLKEPVLVLRRGRPKTTNEGHYTAFAQASDAHAADLIARALSEYDERSEAKRRAEEEAREEARNARYKTIYLPELPEEEAPNDGG